MKRVMRASVSSTGSGTGVIGSSDQKATPRRTIHTKGAISINASRTPGTDHTVTARRQAMKQREPMMPTTAAMWTRRRTAEGSGPGTILLTPAIAGMGIASDGREPGAGAGNDLVGRARERTVAERDDI